MKLLSFFIFASAIYFCKCKDNAFSKRSLSFDTINQDSEAESLLWPKFYQDYIKTRRPCLLQKAYTKNEAYRSWSLDYIYNHYGTALTFRNLTKQNTVSLRNIIAQREYFMQMQFRVPSFLRNDLVLPQCLNCDKVVNQLDAPLWLWHFHETQVKLHSEKAHELWCMVNGAISMTLIPEWTEGMIDHFVTKEILSEAPHYKDLKFYKAALKKGDCFYVPNDFLRQWEPTVDAMAIIFQMNNSIFNQKNLQLDDCKPIEEGLEERPSSLGFEVIGKDGLSLEQINFADDKRKKEGNVLNIGWSTRSFVEFSEDSVDGAFMLRSYIEKLGQDKCIDKTFAKKMYGDGELIEKTAEELFDALDSDHDGEFCWEDVDYWPYEKTRALGKLMLSKADIIRKATTEKLGKLLKPKLDIIRQELEEKNKSSKTNGKQDNDEL